MAPINRGKTGKSEPDLSKILPYLTPPIDEEVLGRVRASLETLLSERTHPMINNLKRQLDLLKHAESVLQHEIESRELSLPSQTGSSAAPSATESNHTSNLIQSLPSSAGEITTPKAKLGENEHRITETIKPGDVKDEEMVDADKLDDGDSNSDNPAGDTESTGNTANELDAEDCASQPKEHEPHYETKTNTSEDPELSDENVHTDPSPLSKINPTSAEPGKENPNNSEDPNASKSLNPADPAAATKNEETAVSFNGKFVPNPKAEYVESQELPVTHFDLFEDVDDEDEERLKKKLGVVSFPKEDLSTLTAGPVPMDDLTNSRPTNQLQFSTYSSFLEPYFRPFTDEDIHFLQQPTVNDGSEAANLRGGKKLSAFVFPPLGPNYKQQWALQDAEIGGNEPPKEPPSELPQLYVPKKQIADLDSRNVEATNTSVSLGPLSERLVAAIFPDVSGTEPASEPVAASIPLKRPSTTTDDLSVLEERVKSEFRYVGLLDISMLRKFDKLKNDFKLAVPPPRDDFADPTAVDIDWVNGSEDDEISRELRFLQSKLKSVSQRNVQYKEFLLPVIKDQLALQEYQSILQDLDKQVDQAYLRRLKAPKVSASKNKKKKVEGADQNLETKIVDQKPAIKALINKRDRWIRNLGPLFSPENTVLREYEQPKFETVEENDDFDDDDDEHEQGDDRMN